MRQAIISICFAGAATGYAFAADVAVTSPPPFVLAAKAVPVIVLVPPRRYLTTYMAHYPFGVLREDYTPVGAPGVSKRDYFGRPVHYAVLHTAARRVHARTRVVLRTRY